MVIATPIVAEPTFGQATSYTWSHDVGSDNPGLLVFCFDSTGTHVSSVTFNGDSLTQVLVYNWNTTRNSYIFKKSAPATGSHNIVATYSTLGYYSNMSHSLSGVDQTDLEDATDTQAGTGSTTSTLTIVNDNAWLVSMASNTNYGPMLAGTGTASRGSNGSISIGDSNGAKTPTGSYSMQWTRPNGASGVVMIAIKPFTGGGSPPSQNSNFLAFFSSWLLAFLTSF